MPRKTEADERGDERPTAAMNPRTLSVTMTPWPSTAGAEADARLTLGRSLRRAWDLFLVNEFDQALALTRELVTRISSPATQANQVDQAAPEIQLVIAAAKTIRGCIAEITGQGKDDSFAEAVGLYDQWLERVSPSARQAQDYRFYGISLHRVGLKERALAAISEALKRGDATVETYRLRGLLLKERGLDEDDLERLDQAENMIREALRLSPGSPTTLEAMGEVLEARRRPEEAAGWYLKAAYASVSATPPRFHQANDTVSRAFRLTPQDVKVSTLRGMILSAMGRYQEALDALEPALRLETPNVEAMVIQGLILRTLGRNEESEAVLRKATASESPPGQAYVELALTLHALRRYREVVEALDLALDRLPDYKQARVMKGEVLLLFLDDPAGAAEELWKAVDLPPKSAAEYTTLGEALRRLGRYDEALDILNRSLALRADDAYTLGTRGRVLRALKRTTEAIKSLRLAMQSPLFPPWVCLELAEVLADDNCHDEALQVLNRALAEEPSNASLLQMKVRVLKALHRDRAVLLTLLDAVDLDPDSGWALTALAQALCLLDYTDEAWDAVSRALERAPNDVEATIVEAKVLCATAKYSQAVESLDRVTKLDNSPALAHGVRGWALENLSSPEEALRSYQAALEREPSNPWWLKGVGNALRILGKGAEAREKYRKVLEVIADSAQPPVPEIISLKGWCHLCLEEYDEAVRYIGQALSMNSDLVTDQFDFSLALLCRKNFAFALREYKKGLSAAEGKPVSRRVGILRVALQDLESAFSVITELRDDPHAREARNLLNAKLEAASSVPLVHYPSGVEGGIDLETTVDVIFARLLQFDDYPTYVTKLENVRPVDSRPQTFTATFRNGSTAWTVEVLEKTPCVRVAWRGVSPGDYAVALTLYPAEDGTRLRVRVSYSSESDLALKEREELIEDALDEALLAFKKLDKTAAMETAFGGSVDR